MMAKKNRTFDRASTNATRTVWMAARARNAAKRGVLVTTVGLLAVVATVLLLVLVPRAVDRVVRARIAALPPLADTLAFIAAADTARVRQRAADSTLRSLQYAAADTIAGAVKVSLSAASNSEVLNTDGRRELAMRIARARTVPLIESYRAIGEAELLRNDARVQPLLDSLNEVNRQREASAALGGPDARYAAMTARIASIGQQLLALADAALSASPEKSDSTAPLADTSRLAPRLSFNVDSMAERVANRLLDSANARVVAADQALANARSANAAAVTDRARTEAQSTVNIPVVAMLLAALALGLAVGYGVAFGFELRQPRVADVAEVERLAGTRVIVHGPATRAALQSRRRRQDDDKLFPVIDTVSEAYQLLHVTLTGFGDTAHSVQIVGDTSLLSATVGINLAAAAARDARATLLVDANSEDRLATSLLHVARQKGVAESAATPLQLRSRIVRTKVDRDHYIDTLFAGTPRPRATSRTEAEQPDGRTAFHDELQALANEHDLTVILSSGDRDERASLLPSSRDAILCVRLGTTKLSWLLRAVVKLRENNLRLRAVLLWAAPQPVLK